MKECEPTITDSECCDMILDGLVDKFGVNKNMFVELIEDIHRKRFETKLMILDDIKYVYAYQFVYDDLCIIEQLCYNIVNNYNMNQYYMINNLDSYMKYTEHREFVNKVLPDTLMFFNTDNPYINTLSSLYMCNVSDNIKNAQTILDCILDNNKITNLYIRDDLNNMILNNKKLQYVEKLIIFDNITRHKHLLRLNIKHFILLEPIDVISYISIQFNIPTSIESLQLCLMSDTSFSINFDRFINLKELKLEIICPDMVYNLDVSKCSKLKSLIIIDKYAILDKLCVPLSLDTFGYKDIRKIPKQVTTLSLWYNCVCEIPTNIKHIILNSEFVNTFNTTIKHMYNKPINQFIHLSVSHLKYRIILTFDRSSWITKYCDKTNIFDQINMIDVCIPSDNNIESITISNRYDVYNKKITLRNIHNIKECTILTNVNKDNFK
jgi:hypothetical protein